MNRFAGNTSHGTKLMIGKDQSDEEKFYIIAQAATQHVDEPRFISFKAMIQTLEAFQPLIAHHNR